MALLQTIIKGKNLDVTPALRTHSEKKLTKLNKYLNESQQARAELMLRCEADQHIAELTVDLNGLILRGEGRSNDMYNSIEDSVDRVERRFSKFKTKIQKRSQGPKISELQVPPVNKEPEGNKEPSIVRTKRFAVKPMDAEEAVMQMELLGHDFFVFANAMSNEVNVVYRRRDGNFGLIEPEF